MRREIALGIDRTISMFGICVRERHIGNREPGSLHLRERRQRRTRQRDQSSRHDGRFHCITPSAHRAMRGIE